MDFLKALMIYMSVLFLMGVENAEMPDPASMPTPVPTVQETQQDTPDEDDQAATLPVAIATPAPANVTSAPAVKTATPAPTMTPNPRYTKLKMGDKNAQVKKLQQRLIALGYMKKGTDDGVYGYQTYNAVRQFQKANGLSVDGVAGKATLTHLYEDKSVQPATTKTPKPTAAPATAGPTAVPDPHAAAGWYKTNATVLLNGSSLVVLQRQDSVLTRSAPGVYLHDGSPMICLDQLCKASGEWALEAQQNGFTLTAAGYVVVVDAGAVLKDGQPVQLASDAAVYDVGEWFVSADFLRQTIGAQVVWDQDDNTLVIRVTDKSMAESDD